MAVDYEQFAQFYDALIGDGSARSDRVLDAISRFDADVTSLLELGCGTGSVLEGLLSISTLVGLDASPEMLSFARNKVPSAEFLLGDMTAFELPSKFDVIACVYDTVNHLSSYNEWESLFESVARHLRPGGLFIFDLNTIGRLHQLVALPPWVHDFDGKTLVMDVLSDGGEKTLWNISISVQEDGKNPTVYRETIREIAVALDVVRNTLAADFELLLEEDDAGDVPTDDSSRAYFVYRRSV